MCPGDTFLLDVGLGKHLYVVLSHPRNEDNKFVAAMISTWDDQRKNDSCVLRVADGHTFLKHDSYVAFNTALLLHESDINRLGAKPKQSFTPQVVSRILQGANSDNSDLPSKYWCIMDRQGLFVDK
ncbi:hypothetical protein FACS1894214_0150 [Planctomycetales bacterium]|nr:hypothetical protein FACS1894214_0150 [Planctomycetales bacterium]